MCQLTQESASDTFSGCAPSLSSSDRRRSSPLPGPGACLVLRHMQLPRPNAAPSAIQEEVDIEDRKRVGALLSTENRLIEMIASGRPLGESLDTLCRLVEQMSPNW